MTCSCGTKNRSFPKLFLLEKWRPPRSTSVRDENKEKNKQKKKRRNTADCDQVGIRFGLLMGDHWSSSGGKKWWVGGDGWMSSFCTISKGAVQLYSVICVILQFRPIVEDLSIE